MMTFFENCSTEMWSNEQRLIHKLDKENTSLKADNSLLNSTICSLNRLVHQRDNTIKRLRSALKELDFENLNSQVVDLVNDKIDLMIKVSDIELEKSFLAVDLKSANRMIQWHRNKWLGDK